ncbi:argininosuccinate lyase [Falsibacillus albus]|uniref:Argininosuccinate lyase n=1 Tax=Falsibacillus albus TaxID=2478915 RepID=A0A3L7K329_9BACI|nr:argininosuccinate lyase [Falsibacillus albus]RLQ97443.1 argininosuccinate lyase [Falsibacillus albus]
MNKKDRILKKEGKKFPGATYAEVVLAPAYEQSKRVLLEPMIAIHKAHLIMLVEQGLLVEEEAGKIMDGIRALDMRAIRETTYDGRYEDLFFLVEDCIMKVAGEAGGSLHLARSRNDMGVAAYRMVLRHELHAALSSLLSFQETLLEAIDQYKETICLGYTHTQQAQPMTFSHYLTGIYDVVDRDFKRLLAAYNTCNASPLGAAAFTTTGFPINRKRVADLLGFPEVVKNAYDAIGGADYLGEIAAAIQLTFINLGRFAQDLLLWSSQEFSAIRVADPYVQTSSIMPQKRNPVSLEHIRALSSSGIGNAQTVLQMLHNTPYGDINDTEDDLQPYLWKGISLIDQVFRLTEAVVGTIDVHEEVLKNRAKHSFATVTELADSVFRETGLSFRTAHAIASEVVNLALSKGLNAEQITAAIVDEASKSIIGSPLNLPEHVIQKAMDPAHFVKVRSVSGGPAPKEVKKGMHARKKELKKKNHLLKCEINRIAECMKKLDDLTENWSSQMDSDS